MLHLHKYPFARLVIPFGAGIWSAVKFELSFPLLYIGIALLVLLSVNFLIAFRLKSYPLRWIFGLLLTALLFIAGIGQVEIRKPKQTEDHFMHLSDAPEYFIARITEPPQHREKSTRIQLSVEGIITDEKNRKSASGKIIAYLPANTSGLNYGDVLVFNRKPDVVPPPLNPHQFDYRSYLARAGILHQVFLRDGSWFRAGKGYVNHLFDVSYKMRGYLLDVLRQAGLDGDEFHVASAILLGYDDHLPAYLRQSYTAAGGMHVLCVSGLHVGIVYLFFSFLLIFPGRNKKTRIIKAFILLLILWFYALLTGLTPSVIRASTMFSFMLIGKTFHKKGYIMNTLAASALFLLWFDPSALFHIGFQLSYAAVAGIVLLQRPIYGMFYFSNWIANKSWEATSVAIAAQLATTPLILHYFGQFPLYFIVSNLLLAPLSLIVIITGMILLLISFVPFVAAWIGWALSGMIYLMNFLIGSIESLPMAVLQPLYLSTAAAAVLSLLVITLMLSPNLGFRKIIIPALASISLFFILQSSNRFSQIKQSKLIVYAIPQHTVIDLIDGQNHILVTDSLARSDQSAIDFFLKKNWMVSGLKNKHELDIAEEAFRDATILKKGPYIEFHHIRMAIWKREKGKYLIPSEKIKVDILVVSGNTPEQLQSVLNFYEFNQIVFDLSVPSWHLEKWKSALNNSDIEYYDIKSQGAYILEI